ncbi:mRNA-capping enzyme subunit beta [Entophlyctis luteolus]|nr:mRNA-capping enzyme subunit beta [Entophlyctis luteolus]
MNEILAASIDGNLRTYDVRKGLCTVDDVGHSVTSARFSNDENCILASSLDGVIRLFDKENGELLASYRGHKNSEYKIISTLSNDDAVVISGSEDGRICLWDLVEVMIAAAREALTFLKGNLMQTVDAHGNGTVGKLVTCVAYHPRDDVIVSTSTDGFCQVFAASRLHPTMFHKDPPDDVIRHVTEWLMGEISKLNNNPHIEQPDASQDRSEARYSRREKISTGDANELERSNRNRFSLIETRERSSVAVVSESYFAQNGRFKSEMSLVSAILIQPFSSKFDKKDYHGNFNRLLNKVVEDQRGLVKYIHRYEVDTFFPPRRRDAPKVRVSKNKKTDEVIAVVEKRRVADLNVFSPATQLDYRISVNVETPVDAPYHGDEPDYQRDKDRLSYIHQCVQVDLTQVVDVSFSHNVLFKLQ